MTPLDSLLHHHLLAAIVAGTPRDAIALAARAGCSIADAETSLTRLADAHAVVLHPNTHDVWIAHPFSCSPTGTWVAGAARGWWAPCMWCAFGIAVLVDDPVTIHARIGGETEPVEITPDSDLLVHFAVPPREAWSNVVHFCAMVLPFRSELDIDRWSARHQLPRGATVPVAKVRALAHRWYGRHRDPTWVKHTTAEAQQIFADVGLTDTFWQLPQLTGRF